MKKSILQSASSIVALTVCSCLTGSIAFAAKADRKGNSSASGTIYSAQAVALKVDGVTSPTPGQIVVCDTGPLPASGGWLQKTQANFTYGNGGLTIDHAAALASGGGPQSSANATLSGYRVEFITGDGHHTHRALIEADYIYSEATASVEKNGRISLETKVVVQGLRVNGVAIAVTGQANQRVNLPEEAGGYLIINEQANAASNTSGDIAVSAIHFYVCHCIEGHVGLVRAGITSDGRPPQPDGDCGKVTGGGWIVGTPSGEKGTFGMSGGIRRGEFWGHLNFIDHGTGMNVSSTAVTGFQVDPSNANGRIISYSVTINGVAGTARLLVIDNGEPGRTDVFDLTLSNGYRAVGELGGARPGGGNIQLHKCPPGWE